MSKEEVMSAAINLTAQEIRSLILKSLDSMTASQKLEKIHELLNSAEPSQAESLIEKLADEDALKSLFKKKDDLGNLLPVLNRCCFLINQSMKRVLTSAIKEKKFEVDLDDQFSKSVSQL